MIQCSILWRLAHRYYFLFNRTIGISTPSFFRRILLLLFLFSGIFSLAGQTSQKTTAAKQSKETYQFKGTFKSTNPHTPFTYNEIRPIQLLELADSTTTLEDLLVNQQHLQWSNDPAKIEPKQDQIYWIKTQLIGDDFFHGTQTLHVSWLGDDRHAFDYVDIYTSTNKREYTHQRTGNAIPLKARPYDFWATFFKVNLQPSDTLDLYVRLAGINKYFPMPTIGLNHVDPSVFTQQINEATKKWIVGGFIGGQFLFFLCLFFIERERIHLYFSIYILGIFIILFFTHINYFTYLPFAEWKYHPDMLNLGILLGMIGLVKFTETYFNYPNSSIYSKIIIPIFIGLSVFDYLRVFFSTTMVATAAYPLGLMLILFGLLFPFWLAINAKGQPKILKTIWFIANALSGLLVGFDIFLNISKFFGMSMEQYKWLVLEGFQYSMLFQLTVFSLSIGYRKNLLKKEKETALEQNLKDQEIIIEKLEQTAQLEKMDAVKTRFFTNITHEFRTPLTVILGMADQLETGSWTTKVSAKEKNRLSNGLALINRNGKKLLQLINQLLDLSKIDNASLKPNYQAKEIVSFVQYTGESFESLAEKKSIRLQIYNEMKPLTMAVDEVKLQKVISNLLANAIKFTPIRGKITLHLSRQNETIQLKVKDNGEGVSKAALPYIFDRFYQADNTSTRQEEGTGIGLALVKELVELMEGNIEVKSELGIGTEFMVRLPIRILETKPLLSTAKLAETEKKVGFHTIEDRKGLAAKPLLTADNGILSDTTKSQVLLVEDNPDVIFYIRSILEPFYQIRTATNGQAGIEQAVECIPDLIVSDVMMPIKDGFELVQTLKEDERTSHIPIVLLTAKATQQDKLDGLKYGADAYLMKPFDKEELLVRLEKLLEIRKALQQRYHKDSLSLMVAKAPKSPEDIFLEKLTNILEKHYTDTELSVKDLAKMLQLSHQQFYRKLKALTDQTPNRYLRNFRLKKAKTLLIADNGLNVSEVTYQVGFDNPNYFSRVFSETYGVSPNAVRK